MADTTRKIYFSVEDNNVESTFNRYKQIANESAQALISNANQYSRVGKEVTKYLEDEIRLREKKVKLEVQERRSDVTDMFERQMLTAKTPEQREKISAAYKGRMKEVSLEEKEMEKQTILLKSILDTLVHTSKEEIREDRKNVEKQVDLFQKGKLKGLSPEEEAKLKIQSSLLGEEKVKEKSPFGGVFLGSLLGNLVPQIINRLSGVVGADSSERAFNSLISGVPLVGDLVAEMRERALQAREELQSSRLNYSAVGGTGRIGLFSGIGYGKTSSDLYDIAAGSARARGMAGGNANVAVDIAALEKAYGLDRGQLMKLTAGERFGGGGAMKDLGMIVEVMKSNGLWDKNSQTKIPEYLELLVSLQEDQIKREGQVDNSRNMANLMAMSKLGDKYFRDTSYITGISSAIANPQNEFQQARSLSVLAGMKPGADLWSLELMQEKGLSQEGYMSGIIKQIKSRYGTGNLGERALYETLKGGGQNISKEDARNIYQQSLKDPQLWDKVVDQESLQSVLQRFSGQTRVLGRARTSELTKDIAQTTEAYTVGALPGAASLIKRAGEDFAKNIEKAGTWFADRFKDLWEGIKDIKVEKKEGGFWAGSVFDRQNNYATE